MLDSQVILKCHLFVPVWYWPVLWHSLVRLQATILYNREQGGGSFAWAVDRTGFIRITWRADSPAERLSRGEIFPDFERAPWARFTLDAPACPAGLELAHDWPGNGLPIACDYTRATPLAEPARAPP